MNEELVTVDTILDAFKEWVENKQSIDAHLWVDSARKLVVLVGEEQNKLFDLEHSLAQFRVGLIENGIEGKKLSMAEVKLRSEASPIYKEIQQLKAKIARVYEHVRIAKLQARLADSEMRGNF